MARNRIILKRIAKDSTRRTTFKKRRNGLMKKAGELASLCGIGTCVVVYGEGEAQLEVWPSVPEARGILSRFKAAPEVDRFKRVMNQEDYLRKRIIHLRERMRKMDDEIRERDTTVVIYQAYAGRCRTVDLTIGELANVGSVMGERVDTLKERFKRLGGEDFLASQPPMQPLPPLMPYGNNIGMDMVGNTPMGVAPQQQSWFMNMASMGAGGHVGTSFYGSYGAGGSAGAGTSAMGGMMQLSNLGSCANLTGTALFPPM